MAERGNAFLRLAGQGVLSLTLVLSSAVTANAQHGKPIPHANSPALPQGQGATQSLSASGWRYDFNGAKLDSTRWIIMNDQAPGYIPNNHIGYFRRNNVSLSNGLLVLSLNQKTGTVDGNRKGVISQGGGIYTQQTYGYGTYEWTMRMSSASSSPLKPGQPVSGSVSAGFIYVNNSQTEIDFEFSGGHPQTLFMTNWTSIDDSSSYTAVAADISDTFHRYKFVWQQGSISYYVDDVLKAASTTNVPTAPAYFMISHWGSNSPYFGGLATVNKPRYFYIDSVSYTP